MTLHKEKITNSGENASPSAGACHPSPLKNIIQILVDIN
jgi:hypothetical protein